MMTTSPRGITLLVSVIFTTVILSVALALLDLSYKQTILSSASKNSQYAFYAADSAMECALYYDQKVNPFYYNETVIDGPGSYVCATVDLLSPSYSATTAFTQTQDVTARTTTFNIPCPAGGTLASVTIRKQVTNATDIYTTGYSSCNSNDPGRIERGLKVHY